VPSFVLLDQRKQAFTVPVELMLNVDFSFIAAIVFLLGR
jgi:hypothetical protein